MKTSKEFSFNYWSLWKFIKGRKKTAVSLLSAALAYFIANDALSAFLAGWIVEGVWGIAEFYVKRVNVK